MANRNLDRNLDDDPQHPNTEQDDSVTRNPSSHLQQILGALSEKTGRDVHRLLEDAVRYAEMAEQLEDAGLRATAEQRFDDVARALTRILAGWRRLGGGVSLSLPHTSDLTAPAVLPVLLDTGPAAGAASPVPSPPEPASAPPVRTSPDPGSEEAGRPGPDAATWTGESPVRGAVVRLPDSRTPSQPSEPPSSPPPPSEPRPQASTSPPSTSPPSAEPPAESPREDWTLDLRDLLQEIRISGNASDEMERIQTATNESFTRWPSYPRTIQRALVGNLACRLRHLQDHLDVTGPKLDATFRALTRYSKSFQPGWVNGLTRGRGPAAESWADEARCWWDQLVASAGGLRTGTPATSAAPEPAEGDLRQLEAVERWIEEWREAPAVAKPMCLEKTLEAIGKARSMGVPPTHPDLCRLAGEIYDHLDPSRFRSLRQAIRDLEQARQEEQGDADPEAIPSDWAWWSHTVGRRGLVIGHRPQESQRRHIEQSFGLASLDWETLEDLERKSASSRIRAGRADLVMIRRDADRPEAVQAAVHACQEAGTPWVLVDRHVGVTRIRLSIERYLQPDPNAGDS